MYPKALWRMDPNEKAVYLTFDDGPIPEATPFILDTLAKYGVKATFFMVGDNVRKYPNLHQRVVDEGHRIGNHTHNHMGGLRHTVTNTAIMWRRPTPICILILCVRPTAGCVTTSMRGSAASSRL